MCTSRTLEDSHKSCDPRDEIPEPEERLLAEVNTALTKSKWIVANRSKDDSDPGSESDDSNENHFGRQGRRPG